MGFDQDEAAGWGALAERHRGLGEADLESDTPKNEGAEDIRVAGKSQSKESRKDNSSSSSSESLCGLEADILSGHHTWGAEHLRSTF